MRTKTDNCELCVSQEAAQSPEETVLFAEEGVTEN